MGTHLGSLKNNICKGTSKWKSKRWKQQVAISVDKEPSEEAKGKKHL